MKKDTLSVKATCCCGATFEAQAPDILTMHSAQMTFLEMHRVCREAYATREESHARTQGQ